MKRVDRAKFFEAVRAKPFNGRLNASQVAGMEGILQAFEQHGDGNPKTLAYALATAYHEVGGRMVPVREGFVDSDAVARKVVAKRAYGKPAGPYGHVYYGRGLVQLTWHENYKKSSADAGVDLERYPDDALDPVIGARLLIKGLIDGRWNGLRKGIGHYLPANGVDDLRNARRTVNITDKWELIGGYYKQFLAAVQASYGAGPAQASPAKPAAAAVTAAVTAAGATHTAGMSGQTTLFIALAVLVAVAVGFAFFKRS